MWLKYLQEVNPEIAKQSIFERTGMVPAIYENGTLFVTNQRLTLEMLKEISDSEDVLEIAGDYTGNVTARGPSHKHSDSCPLRDSDYEYSEELESLDMVYALLSLKHKLIKPVYQLMSNPYDAL